MMNFMKGMKRLCKSSNEEQMDDTEEDVPDSLNLILQQEEMNALKTDHCLRDSCGICKVLGSLEESQLSVVLPVSFKDCCEIEVASSVSLGICRICHCNAESSLDMGALESVCNCRGTVALVHMPCLERWLAESDTSACDLCGFEFIVQRTHRHSLFQSFRVWAREAADYNQLVMDTFWFWLMTPLAVIAGYVFLRAATVLLDDGMSESPWMMVALMLNSFLMLIAYYGWVMGSIKRHFCAWYKWWRTTDSVIKVLIPEKSSAEEEEEKTKMRGK